MSKRKCLSEVTLTSYLGGSLKALERGEAEAHLVGCDGCRGQLVELMRLLDEEVREEEDVVVRAAMEKWEPTAAMEKWEPTAAMRGSVRRRVGWWAAACAGVVLAAGATVFYGTREPDVPGFGEAVALSVLNQPTRSLEARLSVFDTPESYRPYAAVRGAADVGGGVGDLGMESGMGAGSHEMGLFWLASRDFEQAVPLLEQAVIEEETAASRNDLGVAYMEKPWRTPAEATRYRELAARQFEIAVRLDQEFAPALFNRALWAEREAGEEAFRAQAEAYLQVDSASGWAEEIRALGE